MLVRRTRAEKRKDGFSFRVWQRKQNAFAQNVERSACRIFLISILQMLSNMFFAMCGIIIHPHLNRSSQFLHSAMPAAPEKIFTQTAG